VATSVGSVSTGSGAATASTAGTKALGKDDFLKLLLAQMQNQDPLNPMDNSQMVAQLAQFSTLEQMQGVNDRLDTLALAQASANQTQASMLVGKSVSYKTSQLTHTSGAPTPISAQLQGSASAITAVISDASGNKVRTLNFGAQAAGVFSGTWDGRDQAGNELPSGAFTVTMTAVNDAGNQVPIATQSSGNVTGVTFVTGAAQLLVNGAQVPLNSVIEIDQAI
jgi:flagellar basal-body rod modification protein FlgD